MITEIYFNWFSTEVGEEYGEHKVGERGVKVIKNGCTEHILCYAIDFDDGRCELIYNPNRVFYSPKEQR